MGTEHVRRPASAIRQTPPVVLAGSAFVLGVTTGLFLPRIVRQLRDRAGWRMRDRAPQGTIVYDENLPASLARREPAPPSHQPRYGGTGSLGVSPRAVDPALGHEESTDPSTS
jgi:hypothetical protein